MADLLDEFLEGVPNVGGRSVPSVFGDSAVSFEQANRLTADRVNVESQLLETRSRFNKLRREEQTRSEGQSAMSELTRLDPANDPDYMSKVQDILARNPNASLDAAVSNFLEVQGGIFADAEADRDADDELRRRRQEDRREFKLRRKREGILRNDAKAHAEQDEIEEAYDSMTPEQRKTFDRYSQITSDKKALRRVIEETQTATEINMLLTQGIPKAEIYGDEDAGIEGLMGADGRIDPKKLATYMGSMKQAEMIRDRKEQEIQDKRNRLKNLEDYQKLLSDPLNESATPERKKAVSDAIEKLHRELGNIAADTTPEEVGAAVLPGSSSGGSMRDNSRLLGTDTGNARHRKDFHPADRYKPTP